jgi:L-threonylcarbamoyladenylate synthase
MSAELEGTELGAARLERALEALAGGGVVAIPTDTVYGLAVDPTVGGAAGRLFRAKSRPDNAALALLVTGAGEARRLADPVGAEAEALIARWWPGPLTVVLNRSSESAPFELGGDPATIGLRSPAHPLARALLARSGPLAVTSANRHRDAPLTTAADVCAAFSDSVQVVIDGGICDGTPSTVVSCLGPAGTPVRVLREGSIAFGALFA